ncbi:MAG: hypothetical protein HC838_00745 [Spirulinaceae cyanobacterium RM2_2_10]|nr:hypothetical protein [Spirulinaceae cyanobacterium SM2_1_0]NJO18880.1 hypothetical protein [Spirulinaceae cyanobacterium RM2_2_10]
MPNDIPSPSQEPRSPLYEAAKNLYKDEPRSDTPWRSPRAFWTRFVLYGIAAGSLAILGGLNLAVQRQTAFDRQARERAEQAMRDKLAAQIHAYRSLGQFEPMPKDFLDLRGSMKPGMGVVVWTAPPGQPRQLLDGKLFPPDTRQQVIVSGVSYLPPSAGRPRIAQHYLGTVFVRPEGDLAILLCASDHPLRPDVIRLDPDRQGGRCPIGSQPVTD